MRLSLQKKALHRNSFRMRSTMHPEGKKDVHDHVVGFGSVCVDYLAQLARFPNPDEKLRTEDMKMQGGGNVGNALTAASKLGLKTRIVSKIGGDGVGQSILEELRASGIDTNHVLVEEGQPSPFTYVIVDREGSSRTCIHTPGPIMHPTEVDGSMMESLLDGVQLIYFDGRLTEAALELVKGAKKRKIPVLVEAERLRPNLEKLLEHADYVFTSASFPKEWTGEESLGEALLATSARLPEAKFILTTIGNKGSVMLERPRDLSWSTTSVLKLKKKAKELKVSMADVVAAALPDMPSTPMGPLMEDMINHGGKCYDTYHTDLGKSLVGATSVGREGTEICIRSAPLTSSYFKLTVEHPSNSRTERRELAAEDAARANADEGGGNNYSGEEGKRGRWNLAQGDWVCGRLIFCPAADVPAEAIVDTTGAGDAFMGSVLYGLSNNLEYEQMMALGSVVAAIKCGGLGARSALPSAEDIDPILLNVK